MLNRSLPIGSRRVDRWIGGGDGKSGVECRERERAFLGDSLATVRVLQSHPSSLFLWD